MNSVQSYKLNKKKRWIDHQLAQKLLVYCRSDNHLIVIKKVKIIDDKLVAINGATKTILKTQPIYATYSDITNPVGTFREEPLDAAEYVDLICGCF